MAYGAGRRSSSTDGPTGPSPNHVAGQRRWIMLRQLFVSERRTRETLHMTKRVFNFSAGPAMLPLEVLEASAAALVDYQGKGFGIAECSHRGKEFDAVLDESIARC